MNGTLNGASQQKLNREKEAGNKKQESQTIKQVHGSSKNSLGR